LEHSIIQEMKLVIGLTGFNAYPAFQIPAGAVDGPLSFLNIIALLAAVAIAYIAWQAWRVRPRIEGAEQRERTTPPDDLHPSLAGALATGNVDYSQIEAAVLELSRRGALRIEPDDEERAEVQIRLLDLDHAEHAFERELLNTLKERSDEQVVRHQDLRRIRGGWNHARDRLRRDLEERGWFNPNPGQTRLPFTVPGWIGMAYAAGLIVVAIAASSGWPVLGAVIVGLVALAVLGMGSILPITTREGEAQAIPWRGYRSGLARARNGQSIDELDLDLAFPYIVAMKMAASFDSQFQKACRSGFVPSWIGAPAHIAQWPEPWHTYWISLHTAIAPTDSANSKTPKSSATRRFLIGGR
jgi:uncharacterized protein (TIGR04222 family)